MVTDRLKIICLLITSKPLCPLMNSSLIIFAEINCHRKFLSKIFCQSYSPVPRLSFATRFDTKLREKSFRKEYSAKAVLFTMYVPTVGICTQICART